MGAAVVLLALMSREVPPDLEGGADAGVARMRIPVGIIEKEVADTLRLALGIAEVEDPTAVRRNVLAHELAEVRLCARVVCCFAPHACMLFLFFSLYTRLSDFQSTCAFELSGPLATTRILQLCIFSKVGTSREMIFLTTFWTRCV